MTLIITHAPQLQASNYVPPAIFATHAHIYFIQLKKLRSLVTEREPGGGGIWVAGEVSSFLQQHSILCICLYTKLDDWPATCDGQHREVMSKYT